MAKYLTSEVAVRNSNEAVQIHGGYGYTKEYPAEKFYRDSKLCTIGEGTSEIQKLVISRELLREQFFIEKKIIYLHPNKQEDMLIVPVKEGENIERALKKYKKKFDRTGVIKQLRARKQFDKPSVVMRKQKLKAIYVNKVHGDLA